MAPPVGVRDRVLRALAEAGPAGLTAEELLLATGLNRNTAPPELTRLAQAGVVVAVGKRPTTAGKAATVWALSPLAGDGPTVTHVAGPAFSTHAGDSLQASVICGTRIFPTVPEGATAFEQGGAFTGERPTGIAFHSCQRARLRARA